MKNQNMFEVATRGKIRFPFKGMISVEDLWDLTPAQLDSVFKTLNAEKKQTSEESLLNTQTKEDEVLVLKIEIVKYIVSIKLEEQVARDSAKEKREQKQKLLEVLARKENEELEGKSAEEIKKMLEDLA